MGFSTYNYQISQFLFIKVGFFIALVVPTLLLFLCPLAKGKPRAWAKRFVSLCSLVFVGGGGATIVYAVMTGEWQRFLRIMGFGPFFELFMLAFIYFLSMRFMASRTIALLPEQPRPRTDRVTVDAEYLKRLETAAQSSSAKTDPAPPEEG